MNLIESKQDDTRLVRYDAMCLAIAECHRVDEVQEIKNLAVALEHYHKQAKNMDAEWKAAKIRIRAERRMGQILIEMEKAGEIAGKGGNGSNQHGANVAPCDISSKNTLSDLGITRDQSSRYKALANAPDEAFESAIGSTASKPTPRGIVATVKPKPPDDLQAEYRQESTPKPKDRISEKTLWVWGRVMEIQREQLADLDTDALVSELTPEMFSGLCSAVPDAREFFNRLGESCYEKSGNHPSARRHVVVDGHVYEGLRYADMAIEQLKRIEKEDPNRDSALDRVIQWIEKNR